MKLAQLLTQSSTPLTCLNAEFDENTEITHLALDSREVRSGSLFFAIAGAASDGHKFIPQAIASGAAAIIAERDGDYRQECEEKGIPLFTCPNIRFACAELARGFFQNPSAQLHAVGITGTNGKTSVAWMLASIFAAIGGKGGSLGTLGKASMTPGKISIEAHETTTADSLTLNSLMLSLLSEGIDKVAVEVTSQGIAQHRTDNIDWDGAIFTNLTRDHLDLHGTMENYKALKLKLFSEQLASSDKEKKCAVFNIDDETGREFLELIGKEKDIQAISYSMKNKEADFYLDNSENKLNGTAITVHASRQNKNGSKDEETVTLQTKLIGDYNISNSLAVFAYLYTQGYSSEQLINAFAEVSTVPGRLERITHKKLNVFVDYAHTPDALVSVQQSLRPLVSGKLITVFGCGGDRDRGKRPQMASAVAELSDLGIATSDNPRTEDPDQIVADTCEGFKEHPNFNYQAEVDRKTAIAAAIKMAGPEDAVLIAGKGHEPYQDVMGVKHPFDDRDIAREILESL